MSMFNELYTKFQEWKVKYRDFINLQFGQKGMCKTGAQRDDVVEESKMDERKEETVAMMKVGLAMAMMGAADVLGPAASQMDTSPMGVIEEGPAAVIEKGVIAFPASCGPWSQDGRASVPSIAINQATEKGFRGLLEITSCHNVPKKPEMEM